METKREVYDRYLEEYRQQTEREGQAAFAVYRLLDDSGLGLGLKDLLRNHLGSRQLLEVSARLQDALEDYMASHKATSYTLRYLYERSSLKAGRE